MKNICLLFCVGWLLVGCQKMETGAVFTVNCQFPDFAFGPKGLIVTNAAGAIVHSFSIPSDATAFNGQFTLSGNTLAEKLDLHLVLNNAQIFQPPVIFSRLRVSSGELVYFINANVVQDKSLPIRLPITAANFTWFTFKGIYAIDSFAIENYTSNPADLTIFPDSTVKVILMMRDTQNILVRIRANGESVARYAILHWQPADNRGGVLLNWNDFRPIGNPTTIELPDGLQALHSEVTALSPKRFTFTSLANDGLPGDVSYVPYFWWPDEFKTSGLLRVWVQTDHAEFEQIFQPGQPIRFESSGMQIEQATLVAGKELTVRTSGDVDLIRVRSVDFSSPFRSAQWQIDGPPDAFTNYILPDFSAFTASSWANIPFFSNFIVEAHQFAQYNYPEVNAGYPWRSFVTDGLYAVANSGHKVVSEQH